MVRAAAVCAVAIGVIACCLRVEALRAGNFLDPSPGQGGIFVTTRNTLEDMKIYGSVDVLCSDSCVAWKQEYFGGDYLRDYCADGGPGNGTVIPYNFCPLGSDCSACGPRTVVEFDTIEEAVGNYTDDDGLFDGSLYVENTNLESLDGMQPVRIINGNLAFRYNFQLEDTTALRNLIGVDKSFIIMRNLLPGSLLGLEAITSVGEDFYFNNNTLMERIVNMDNLRTVGGGLSIEFNGMLEIVVMFGLRSVGAAFPYDYSNNEVYIGDNPIIYEAYFESLRYVEGDFYIQYNNGWNGDGPKNTTFEVLAFQSLESTSSYSLYNNDGPLEIFGPPTFKKVGAGPSAWGYFEIGRMAAKRVSGFDRLESLGDQQGLSIYENDYLESVSGFNSLIGIGNSSCTPEYYCDLEIYGNANLQNITGFGAVTTIYGNLILNSTALEHFDAFATLELVDGCCELDPAWLLDSLPACQGKLCASTISA